jgi:phosphorylcholine metabolism protein LicD
MVGYVNRKNEITSDLIACKTAFDQAGVPWIIIGGVVLGYARYKDIMDWDTDLDLAVPVELSNEKWQLLWRSLNEQGFRILNIKTDFILSHRKAEFNMWCFHKNGDYYEAFPKSTPGIKFVEKAIWYDYPQLVDFIGSKYPMPNNLDDYLVCQYGKDWKTNVVTDHEQYYLDKRGTRDVGAWPAGKATKDGPLWPKTLKIGDNM